MAFFVWKALIEGEFYYGIQLLTNTKSLLLVLLPLKILVGIPLFNTMDLVMTKLAMTIR
jgi:hypothetical protein